MHHHTQTLSCFQSQDHTARNPTLTSYLILSPLTTSTLSTSDRGLPRRHRTWRHECALRWRCWLSCIGGLATVTLPGDTRPAVRPLQHCEAELRERSDAAPDWVCHAVKDWCAKSCEDLRWRKIRKQVRILQETLQKLKIGKFVLSLPRSCPKYLSVFKPCVGAWLKVLHLRRSKD